MKHRVVALRFALWVVALVAAATFPWTGTRAAEAQTTESRVEYRVQIGALRHPDPGFGVDAMSAGAVTTSESPDGLVRFRVGPFATYREARAARSKLRAAGYEDAFIQRSLPAPTIKAGIAQAPPAIAAPAPEAAAAPPERSHTEPETDVAAAPAPEAKPASTLPEDVQVKLVYLGGELYIKEGTRFTPLSKYTRGRP